MFNMISGLVSTIIPVYNRPVMLLEAVQSVLNQTYKPIEIIIVDDGSTDNTNLVAQSCCLDNKEVKLITIKNSGVGSARETGRNVAKGEFIQYLDSDDLLFPDKFQLQVEGLNTNQECGISYCRTSIEITSEKKIIENWKRTGEHINNIFPSMLAGRWWGTSTPLYRSCITDKAGPWKEWINEEDWEYDCRIACINGKLHFINQTLSLERQHNDMRLSNDGSTSKVKLKSRVKAHKEVLDHAIKSNITCESNDFQTLVKSIFLLSRKCGAAGLPIESKSLFELVNDHWCGNKKTKLLLYHIGAKLIGWGEMGKLSDILDKIRL